MRGRAYPARQTERQPPSYMMPYHISVNREHCASNAECVSLAPEVFELDDEEICAVLDPEGAKDKRILLTARAWSGRRDYSG